MRKGRVNLDKPSYEMARFATVCAVGRSVRANLKNLFDATYGKSNPNWSEIIDSINAFVDKVLPASGTSTSPDRQIKLVRDTVSGLAGVAWPEANPQLHSAMAQLARQIKPFKKGELALHLQNLYQASISLAYDCVMKWGGPLVIPAMEKAKSEGRGKLIFVSEGGGTTYAYTQEDKNGRFLVSLVIGNSDNMLKSYLSFEFYFFHEYLSHVFPTWDDLSGKLSDGYLFPLEKAYFRGNCHLLENGFALHSRIVDEDLVAHRQRTGKAQGSQADREGLYMWLDSNCSRGWVPRLLLEMCSRPRPSRLCEKMLAIFELVANRQDVRLAEILCDPNVSLQERYNRLRSRILPSRQFFRASARDPKYDADNTRHRDPRAMAGVNS